MKFQSSSMVIAGLFGAGIFLGWNTVKEVEASVVYVDPLSIEYDRSREDKAATAWHSGNYGIAVSLWRLRADHDADAQYGLGVAYLEGKGVSPNLEMAVSWFLKAANQQHLYAMFNVGTAYWIGRGIEKNRKEAVFWWRNAAHDGLPRAQYNIGLSYYYGEAGAVGKDHDKAHRWLTRAASHQHKGALKALERFGVSEITMEEKVRQASLNNWAMTPEEEHAYVQGLDRPSIQAIRQYLDDCLAGEIKDFAFPCEPQSESPPGWSIKEHPLESVNGRFLVLRSIESEYGGDIYRLLFTNSPYLVVDVWVYDLDPDGQPDIRSFIQYEMDAHAHQSLVNFCRVYIDDPIFSK